MSKDQGKSKSKAEQKHAHAGKDNKKIDPTELSEDELNKISGGIGSPSPDEIKNFVKGEG